MATSAVHPTRGATMKYAVLLYADATFEARPGAPEWDASLPHHGAFNARLAEGGHMVAGAALFGIDQATSLRVRDGERLVTDGPFAETKEQLWGFYLIEAADLDEALALSGELWEVEHGTVEIRPVIPMPGG